VRRSAFLGRIVVLALAGVSAVALVGGTANGGISKKHVATTWTSAEVAKKLPSRHITVIYNVPKKLPRKYNLGFINWSIAYPFFGEWSKGMHAAAKLYGVHFYEADAAFDTTKELGLYTQLEANKLDVVGVMPGNAAVVQAALADGVKAMTIDAPTKGAAGIGIPDKVAGAVGGEFLGKALKAKVAGPWKGKKIFYVGFGGAGCGACDTRVNVVLAHIKRYVTISGSVIRETDAAPADVQRTMTDIITAHPGWAFVITSYGDELPAAAIPALQSTNNMSNAAVLSMGGDATGRKLVRDYPGTVVGAVDFNPFAEGFNWVAGAIAYMQHKHFIQYPVTTILTTANVNKLYPNDNG
jgi:ABC-type sugar transport system substrate-binding protein